MTVSLGISNVQQATHIRWSGGRSEYNTHPPVFRREMAEFYSGVVVTNWSAVAPIEQGVFKCFVPINTRRKLLNYTGSDDLEIATLAHPTTFITSGDDDDSLIGIDLAVARIEENRFPGIAGRPKVLVLSMNAAILRGNLLRVAYHIVVKSKGLIETEATEHDPEVLQLDAMPQVPENVGPA